MKKVIILFTLTSILFAISFVIAQEEEIEQIPAGMEMIKVGATRLVVPRGTTVQKKGGLIILENINEYVARQLFALDARIQAIEERGERNQEQLRILHQRLKDIEEKMVSERTRLD
jgi:hypothetical protein